MWVKVSKKSSRSNIFTDAKSIFTTVACVLRRQNRFRRFSLPYGSIANRKSGSSVLRFGISIKCQGSRQRIFTFQNTHLSCRVKMTFVFNIEAGHLKIDLPRIRAHKKKVRLWIYKNILVSHDARELYVVFSNSIFSPRKLVLTEWSRNVFPPPLSENIVGSLSYYLFDCQQFLWITATYPDPFISSHTFQDI